MSANAGPRGVTSCMPEVVTKNLIESSSPLLPIFRDRLNLDVRCASTCYVVLGLFCVFIFILARKGLGFFLTYLCFVLVVLSLPERFTKVLVDMNARRVRG